VKCEPTADRLSWNRKIIHLFVIARARHDAAQDLRQVRSLPERHVFNSFHRSHSFGEGSFRQSSETILRLAAQVQLDLLSLQPFFFIGVHDV